MSFGHHLGWSLMLVLMIGDCCIAKAMAQPLVRLEEDELSFWQVTDIHFDLNVVSSATLCCLSNATCCFTGSPLPYEESVACAEQGCPLTSNRTCHWPGANSGFWGTRGCDAPSALVQEVFREFDGVLGRSHSSRWPSFVAWTGDTPRHNRDAALPQSAAEMTQELQFVTNLFSSVFSSRQIPVFPCVGNNDVLPHDSVAQGPNAVLERLYQSWAPLLPSKRAREDFLAGGYYFADVGASSVRVVALNTIYFFAQNQFASNCTDPASPGAVHLRWLKEVISQSATDHRHVYFIGHVPPSNWIPSCSVLFFQLVESALPDRVIMQGSSFGHLHSDQVQLWQQPRPDGTLATLGVSFCAPSIVPSFNPAFRSLSYRLSAAGDDAQAIPELLDWSQFYYSLNVSAAFTPVFSQTPFTWRFEYSPLQSYNMSNLSVASWVEFFGRSATDPALAERYRTHSRVSSPAPLFDSPYCAHPECST